jgi:SAM-dependent methyltransferase
MNKNAYVEMQKIEDTHWWFVARRKIIEKQIKNIPSPKYKILEVGCGTGGNLSMLKQFGSVKAFEMDRSAIEMIKLKAINDITVEFGKCPNQIPFREEKFDLICIFDVLEHINNDIETLIELKKLLNFNGKIIITVPAHQWLFGNHDLFLNHCRRYSHFSLKEVIKKSKFKIDKISYFNTILFPLALIERLFIIPFKKSIGLNKPSKIINNFLCNIFSVESYILVKMNLYFGLSLICVISDNEN